MGCWTPPFGNPQVSLRYPDWPNSSPLARLELRCRWGRPRARARSPRLPHLHRFGLGGFAPWPPRSQKGKVCRSCATAHGTTSETAFAAKLSQVSRKLLPRKRLGVPSLPSRGCAEGTLARPQWGNPKGGAALFGQSLPTFCWSESGGPARPERVEGQRKIFKKRRRRTNKFPNRKAGGAEALKSAPSASKDKEKFLRKGAGEQTSFPTEKPGAPKPLKVHRARRRTKKNF